MDEEPIGEQHVRDARVHKTRINDALNDLNFGGGVYTLYTYRFTVDRSHLFAVGFLSFGRERRIERVPQT